MIKFLSLFIFIWMVGLFFMYLSLGKSFNWKLFCLFCVFIFCCCYMVLVFFSFFLMKQISNGCFILLFLFFIFFLDLMILFFKVFEMSIKNYSFFSFGLNCFSFGLSSFFVMLVVLLIFVCFVFSLCSKFMFFEDFYSVFFVMLILFSFFYSLLKMFMVNKVGFVFSIFSKLSIFVLFVVLVVSLIGLVISQKVILIMFFLVFSSFSSILLVLLGYGVSFNSLSMVFFKLVCDLSILFFLYGLWSICGNNSFSLLIKDVNVFYGTGVSSSLGVLNVFDYSGFNNYQWFLFMPLVGYSLGYPLGIWIYWAMSANSFVSSFLHSSGFVSVGLMLYSSFVYFNWICVGSFFFEVIGNLSVFGVVLNCLGVLCSSDLKGGFGYLSGASICFCFCLVLFYPNLFCVYFFISSLIKIFGFYLVDSMSVNIGKFSSYEFNWFDTMCYLLYSIVLVVFVCGSHFFSFGLLINECSCMDLLLDSVSDYYMYKITKCIGYLVLFKVFTLFLFCMKFSKLELEFVLDLKHKKCYSFSVFGFTFYYSCYCILFLACFCFIFFFILFYLYAIEINLYSDLSGCVMHSYFFLGLLNVYFFGMEDASSTYEYWESWFKTMFYYLSKVGFSLFCFFVIKIPIYDSSVSSNVLFFSYFTFCWISSSFINNCFFKEFVFNSWNFFGSVNSMVGYFTLINFIILVFFMCVFII